MRSPCRYAIAMHGQTALAKRPTRNGWKPRTSLVDGLIHPPPSATFALTTAATWTLPEDVLVEIFGAYRLQDTTGWLCQMNWLTLVHVCRRWRQAIFRSSRRLNLQAHCTSGTRVESIATHFSHLPLVLHYPGRKPQARWNPQDEDCVRFALNSGRAHTVDLQIDDLVAPHALEGLSRHAPILENLRIDFPDGTKLKIPSDLFGDKLAPLHSLSLCGVALPAQLPFLHRIPTLTSLSLERISLPTRTILHNLIDSMGDMPSLNSLSIGFLHASSRDAYDTVDERRQQDRPRMQVPLPSLRELKFHGVRQYLEELSSRVLAPLLTTLDVTLYNQLTLTVPHFAKFLHRTVLCSTPSSGQLKFSNGTSVSIELEAQEKSPGQRPPCKVLISCRPFDWQISSIAQICHQISGILSDIRELYIQFDGKRISREWRDAVDPDIRWYLLESFRGIRVLRVDVGINTELRCASDPDIGRQIARVLPNLTLLEWIVLNCSGGYHAFGCLPANSRRADMRSFLRGHVLRHYTNISSIHFETRFRIG
ncbi:hypothetical protein BC834DRAFT_433897 [Gloeopeniophorella convolvens]|nr:hypothetical protein BC834DRAFT_433897 [Gloeopeniophorella convolvens]